MEHHEIVSRNVLSTSDYIGGGLAMILNIVALLVLLGFIGILVYGAFSQRQLVTSWNPSEEQTFVPHESYMRASHSKAWLFSLITAGVVGLFVVGVYFGVTPTIKDMTKDMNMDNLGKKKAAPKVEPATPAPAAATPAAPPAAAAPAAAPAEKPADPPK